MIKQKYYELKMGDKFLFTANVKYLNLNEINISFKDNQMFFNSGDIFYKTNIPAKLNETITLRKSIRAMEMSYSC